MTEWLRLGIDPRPAQQGMREYDRATDGVVRSAERASGANAKLGGSMDSVGEATRRMTGAIAALGVTVGAGALLRGLIEVNREAERLQAQLYTTEGSAVAAANAFRMIEEFAVSTPFSIEELTSSLVQLRIRGVEPTQEQLTALGDLASAFGRRYTDVAAAVASAAAGQTEPLRNLGFEVANAGDQVTLSFDGMERTVQRSASNIVAAMTELTGDRLAGAMEREMNTINGAISNLWDNVGKLARGIGGSGGLNAEIFNAVQQMNELLEVLNENERAIQVWSGRVVDASVALGAAGLAGGLVAVGRGIKGLALTQATVAFASLAVQVRSVSAGVALLQAALGPVGWLTAGLTAVTAGVYAWRRALREATVDVSGLRAELDAMHEATLERIRTQQTLPEITFTVSRRDESVAAVEEAVDHQEDLNAAMERTAKVVKEVRDLEEQRALAQRLVAQQGKDAELERQAAARAAADSERDRLERTRAAIQLQEDLARATLQVAEAMGLLDRDAERALQSVVQIGASIGRLAAGDMGGLSGLIGGTVSLVSSLFGPDEEQKRLDEERNDLLKRNQLTLEQLRDLSSGFGPTEYGGLADATAAINNRAFLPDASHALFARKMGEALETALEGGKVGEEWRKHWDDFLAQFGLTFEEYVAGIRRTGIEFFDSAGRLVPNALDLAEESFRKFGEGVAEIAEEAARRAAEASLQLRENMYVRGARAAGRDTQAARAGLIFSQRRELAGAAPEDLEALGVLHQMERGQFELNLALEAVESAAREQIEKLDEQLQAQEEALRLAEDQLRTQERTVEELQGVIDGLQRFKDSLKLGPLSVLSPADQLAEARRQFGAVEARALAGDAEAAAQLPQVAQALLEASRDYNASGAGFQADYNRVLAASEQAQATARDSLVLQELQLAEAKRQTEKLDRQIDELRAQQNTTWDSAVAQMNAMRAEHLSETNNLWKTLQGILGIGEDIGEGDDSVKGKLGTIAQELAKEAGEETVGDWAEAYRGLNDYWTGHLANVEAGYKAQIQMLTDEINRLMGVSQQNVVVNQAGFTGMFDALTNLLSEVGGVKGELERAAQALAVGQFDEGR